MSALQAPLGLPIRDGVTASVIVLPNDHAGRWPLVLDFLDDRFPTVPRAEIVARMKQGDVRNSAGEAVHADTRYVPLQKLYYYRAIKDETPVPFAEQVLFEDDYLVVADKPHFLPVTPGGRFVQETLLVRLRNRLKIDTLAPMHRIDRETAGLVLFTKRPDTRGRYQSLFEQRLVEKTYLAVAERNAAIPSIPSAARRYQSRLVQSEHFMRMQEVEGEPNAVTEIVCLTETDSRALYQLSPLTGKKHQLRIHMFSMGMPILNDQIYPYHASLEEEDFTRPLQLLAHRISFVDPITQVLREFTSRQRLSAWLDWPMQSNNATTESAQTPTTSSEPA
jgi:tRNA pseudouridine32 synthase / 23S rRNA pseudouridine746 synthase